jgi:transposase
LIKKTTTLKKKALVMKIPDSAWEAIKDILPVKKSKVGRPEMCPRKALNGILYVLKAGCQWSLLPKEYGSYKTVHGKFMHWSRGGVIQKLFKRCRKIYKKIHGHSNWFAFDTSSKKGPYATFGGKNPTDRAKQGIKHVLLVDRKGAPMAANVASANTHDSQLFQPVLTTLKKTKKVRIVATDSAWDVKELRENCKKQNIALIASPNPRRKKNVHKFNVPHRWIVEQTFGILSWFRGLKTCWAKTMHSSLSFLQIACSHRLLTMAGIFR